MRRTIALLIVTLFAGFALLTLSLSSATAHRIGQERRTAAGCRTLVKPAKRDACLVCVARPNPHHYHPGFPKGERCRPNNGRP